MTPRPPSCQGCTKSCATYFTLVAGGKAETYGCCQGCPAVPKADGDGLLPSAALGLKLAAPLPLGRGKCPTCGLRWSDFERTHRMGCPTCYQAHGQEILGTLGRLQPGLEHHGRRPDSRPDRRHRLDEARRSLQEAQRTEDFETAAALRDEIAELEARLRTERG